MASFTEQATLRVIDQSSAAIRKINAELKKLDATAKALKSTTINLKVNDQGVQSAIRNLRSLKREVDQLRNARLNLHANASQLQNANRQLNSLAHNIGQLSARRVNIQANLQGLNQALAQINRLRAAAARPITVNTQAGGGGGPPGAGGGRGRGGGAAARQTGIRHEFGNFSALRGAASVLIGGTAYAVAANMMRAMGEGIKDVDTGETSLMLKQLDRVYGEHAHNRAKGMLSAAQDDAGKLLGGAFWNYGQRAQNFSEALGMAPGKDLTKPGRGRPSGAPEYRPALAITSELEEMARTLIGLGQSSEKANEQALNFAKGLEQTGRFTDRLTSAFDTDKMRESFEYFRKLAPTIGKEFSGDFARQMIKYLSTEKYTVSNEALGAVMLMGEEMGTRAAVGYHQAVKQLSGQGQKKAQIGYMIEQGLLTVTGYKGGKPARPATRGRPARPATKGAPIIGGVVDEDLLRENLPKWLAKHGVPILEEQGRAEAKKQVESGEISTAQVEQFVNKYKTDPNKIAALAYKLVGDRTAVETVAGFLERAEEIQRSLAEVAQRSGKPEDIRKATEFSINIATAQLSNQFKGAMGGIAQSAAPWLVPQMQRASKEFSGIATSFRDAQAKGEVPLDAMARISSAMTPIAIGAAIASAVSDPRNAPMAAAAIGLITAGNLLVQAANKMNGVVNDPNQPFKPTTPEGVTRQDYQRQLAVKEKELRDVQKVDKGEEDNVNLLRRYVEKEEAATRERPNRPISVKARDAYAVAVKKIAEFEAQAAARQAQVEKLQGEIRELQGQVDKAVYEETTGKEYDEKMRLYTEARREEAKAAEAERVRIKAMTPAERKKYWAERNRPPPPMEKQVPGQQYNMPLPRPRPPDIVEDPIPVKVEPPEPRPDQLPPPPPPPPPLPAELLPPKDPIKVTPMPSVSDPLRPPPSLFLPNLFPQPSVKPLTEFITPVPLSSLITPTATTPPEVVPPPAPRPLSDFITPVSLSSLIIVPPQPAVTPPPAAAPPMIPPAPQPADRFIDPGSVPQLFNATWTSGASTIGNSGTTVGSNAASSLQGQAGSIGGAIGAAAAARISQATVNVSIPSQVASKPADTAPLRA